MANVNVNRSVTDAFYRYKMPKIIAKVEGKGNGIKTVIVNMPEVAKSLQRPPSYPTKYFGCELGAQTQLDPKNSRYIVNGAHDASKLQDLLDGFIKRFVLCPDCDNPETTLSIQAKQGMIRQRCIACGHQGNIDMRHKLTTYILKNPSDQDPTSSTPNKKDKRKDKKSKKEVNGDSSPRANEEDGQDEIGTPPDTEKKNSTANDDDDDWGEDTSDAAVQARMAALSDAAKCLTMTDDLEKSQQERINILYAFIKGKKESNALTGCDKDILAEAERLEMKDKAPLILVELLFDVGILQQIKLYRTHFLRFTHNNKKAQKYLLGGIEQLVGNVHKEALMPKVPHIMKALYDNDILEEDVLIDWDQKVSKKYVSKEVAKEIHEHAQPIIKWLKEAEEESSEEDDEDDSEDDVEFDEKPAARPAAKPAAAPAPVNAEDEEDDFDIDAI